jgi:multicomponent K+:H+ antiporter subunit D
MAGFSVLVSSGTLLAIISYENTGVTAGALYYLVNSTLALSCFYLLVDVMERGRGAEANVFAVTLEAYGDDEEPIHEEEIGIATPRALALLGIAFTCCALVLAGMPPFSGFVAKFAVIAAVFNLEGLGTPTVISTASWTLVTLLIFSGLASMIALLRAGINTFWVSFDGDLPRVRGIEMLPILSLLTLCLLMTLLAGPTMTYMEATAQALQLPGGYTGTVLATGQGPAR